MWRAFVVVALCVGCMADGVDTAALQQRIVELCELHAQELYKDAAMTRGFCRFVEHLRTDGHLETMAGELRKLQGIEEWETAVDWALKDMVAAKHDHKTDDDHRMALLLEEHLTEVVGSMLVFHEHSENL